MGVCAFGRVIFHNVSNNQFDAYILCTGTVHEGRKGVSAIVGQVFIFSFPINPDVFYIESVDKRTYICKGNGIQKRKMFVPVRK